jgi:ABC-type Fe3+ transport system permease subunit
MTAIGFDPLAIYYIIALIAIPVLGLLYTALTENWYWKGFKDGKQLAQNDYSARNIERSR